MSAALLYRTTASCALALSLSLSVHAAPAASPFAISITPIGTYATGIFDASAAEIVAHDPRTQRLFVVNAKNDAIDVLDVLNPGSPGLLFSVDMGGVVNSVAVYKGLVAVAVEAATKTDPGKVVFFNAADDKDSAEAFADAVAVEVGALPDMLVFTPDGKRVLVANEGEPNDDYTIDPEGSVSIIDLPRNIRRLTQDHVRTATFEKFNDAELDPSVRIFGPGASVAQDVEPEYITVSKDSKTAWVALQENNAIAVLDIKAGEFTAIHGLGFKDHLLPGNELDVSDRDKIINIANWPVFGIYQPDAIASYQYRGRTYIVTANEGDARDYDGFSEEFRVKDLRLDPAAFPNADELQKDGKLGRLNVTSTLGFGNSCAPSDPNNVMLNEDDEYDRSYVEENCEYSELYAYGARSFSIYNDKIEQVYDSGSDFEDITAEANPEFFNSNHEENAFDNRSDNKGPEPEGVTVAKLWGRTYAFIGLERIGQVMIYDISNPYAPQFVQYFNNRDFNSQPGTPKAGDLGAEGLIVIEASKSPIRGVPLLVVANEVSGTTTIFKINRERRVGTPRSR